MNQAVNQMNEFSRTDIGNTADFMAAGRKGNTIFLLIRFVSAWLQRMRRVY